MYTENKKEEEYPWEIQQTPINFIEGTALSHWFRFCYWEDKEPIYLVPLQEDKITILHSARFFFRIILLLVQIHVHPPLIQNLRERKRVLRSSPINEPHYCLLTVQDNCWRREFIHYKRALIGPNKADW